MLVKRLFFSALVVSASLYIAGCGGSSHSGGGGSNNPTLTINAVTLPTGYAGANYTSTTLTATGGSGSGYTWTVSSGSSLPAGIVLSSAGVVSGKPTAEGTTSFTVKVTDSASATATSQFSVLVKPGVSITSAAALPDAFVGVSYSQTFVATGGSGSGYTWTLASGSTLPDGLALSSAGVLSGKPTVAGPVNISVTVTDSVKNSATAQFSGTIKGGVSVLTPPAMPAAYMGSFYAQELKATGGSGAGYTWSLAGAATLRAHARRMTPGGLPDGLSLSSDGWISGTPTQTGTSTTTVIVTDPAGTSAGIDLTFTIDPGITITTAATLPGGGPGDLYSQKLTATGGSGTGYTWTATNGIIPGGLRLSADGTMIGNLPAVNTYSFGVTVTDSAQNTASATFTIKVTNDLRITTPSTLLTAYVGVDYSIRFQAKGGAGSGYTFTLAAGSTLPAGFTLTNGGVFSGKPTAAGTFEFEITVKDSNSNTATEDFLLTVNPAVTITTPSTLPAATVGVAYSQALIATGGAGSGYIFTLTSGGSSLSAIGLTLSSGGVLSGTPSATGSAAFSVSVVDSAINYGSGSFTVTVNEPGQGFAVSGHIMLGNSCGSASIPAITLTANTNPARTTTTDGAGNYTFANLPAGDYIITPSITGANAIFSPGSIAVTVSNAAMTEQNFVATLAYKVSGTVSYSGAQTGQIYIWLINKNCGRNPLGTSIAAPGSFTIEGVPPGSYMLGAGIDSLGFGYQNDVDAAGLASPDVTLFDTDVTGTTITLNNPNESSLPDQGPAINAITPNAAGVVVNFQPVVGPHPVFNRIELADTYAVQFTQDPTFALINQTLFFKAGGSNGTGVLILNDSRLASGNTYYFRMLAQATVQNVVHNSHWAIYSTDGVNATPVTIGEPAGNLVSGTVTFDATPTGPLYVGYYDQSTGAVYTTRIASPVSPQPYSLKVPTGASYFHFAILDQNNDGMIDPGDVSNTRTDNIALAAVSADMTNQNIDLNSTSASTAKLTTQHTKSTNEDESVVETYSLSFEVKQGNKLPVSVRLTAGPHVLHPVDLGKCLDCGNNKFQYSVNTLADMPTVGDSYSLLVTYSDDTSETMTAQVTSVMNDFASDLSPSGNSSNSLTPTFTWTQPANPGNFQYSFYMNDNQGHTIWQIPGNNSQSYGFSSSITSIDWGTDPTGGGSTPAGSLTHGATYFWQIQVMDGNGNSTMTRTYYKP